MINKQKLTVKTTAVIFLIMLLITACSSGKTETDIQEEEKPENPLEGASLNIWSDPGDIFTIRQGTVLYDCVFSRISDIEKNNSCKITVTGEKTANNLTAGNATGISPCDIIYMYGDNPLFELAYTGNLFPLTEVKDIINYEDSEKYGNAGTLECAMCDGIPYAVQPCYWPGYQDVFLPCIVYNKGMLQEANLADLHEYYNNKAWTWDTYRTVTETYNISRDEGYVAAMASNAGMFLSSVLYSNGYKLIDYIDGELQLSVGQPNVAAALTWASALYSDMPEKMINTEYWSDSEFMNGEAFMHIVIGRGLIQSSIMYDSDIITGIMPFPCGPNVEYGQWGGWQEGISGFAIPVYASDPEASATIISMLFEPFDEFGGADGLAGYLTENVFTDAVDTEIYLSLGKYSRYSYWTVNGNAFVSRARDRFRSASASEIISKYEDLDTAAVEKYIKGNYENYIYDHMYGSNKG